MSNKFAYFLDQSIKLAITLGVLAWISVGYWSEVLVKHISL